jgi:hypothetical protein
MSTYPTSPALPPSYIVLYVPTKSNVIADEMDQFIEAGIKQKL